MTRSLALAALLLATPALAEDIPGMHLVCEPLGTPHYHHHHVAHVHLFSYVRPTIRHHAHHRRICHHAHQRCHWEEDLGGPPGYSLGGDSGVFEAASGGEGFGGFAGAADMGGAFGGGPVLPVYLFVIVDRLPLVTQPIVDVGPPPYVGGPPVTTPVVAVPEPSTWAMLLLGLGSFCLVKRWRKVR